ncbi:MAG: phosphatidylserine/phosphatidylglycerophosphate/cardiolipin synthase family protein [Clostridia bacterium]|nr:phosphatidylserine/phosphatidylglycerophosphate/cardiolipin synthase family protein [Clostridia bacterium]
MVEAEPYRDLTLLVDGKNAFPEIIRCIEQAEKSVYINMFIWRDDDIGNRMAEAVLTAAERGAQVHLSIDRYGVVLEKCEECKKSFFHKQQSLLEKAKIKVLERCYPMPGAPKKARDVESELYRRLVTHPRVTVSCDEFKADHSKYYIVDDRVLFLGGINIEDKENGVDLQGRVYQDYMVRMTGEAYVSAFREKIEQGKEMGLDVSFGINKKKLSLFEMEEKYLSIINGAQEELLITMAYFSPLPRFIDAIVKAHCRGVRVTVMIPERANFQSDTNRKTVRRLLKETDNGITVLLSPKMLHTKLVASEKIISLGSTNITKKAFRQLDELNLFVENKPCAFCEACLASVRENHALARRASSYQEITYRKPYAFFEGFLV